MNAARATENAPVEEETTLAPVPASPPAGRDGGAAAVTDEDVDAEHIRAVWEMAALTALDSIRDTPDATGAADAAGSPGAPGNPGTFDAPGGEPPSAAGSAGATPGSGATAPGWAPQAPGREASRGRGSAAPAPGASRAPVDFAAEADPVRGSAGAAWGSAGEAAPGPWAEAPEGIGASAGVAGAGVPGGAVRDDGASGVGASGFGDAEVWGESGGGGAGPGTERLTDRFRKGSGEGAAPALKVARRGGGDPVKGLLHHHRDLCEQAVDAFEIAAGLEAHGLTDRTAARYRHRDVFSLAEEMFARAERTALAARPVPAPAPHAGRPGLPPRVAAPGVVGALALAAVAVTDGGQRLAAGTAGALATGLALLYALRSGPLRARGRRAPRAALLWTLWLLGYAVCGPGLIGEIAGGGPEGGVPLSAAPLLVAAVAVVPAAWCARLLSAGAGRRIRTSRSLDAFAAAARPLLLCVVALFTALLTALAVPAALVLPGAAGTAAPTVALGALLFLARLMVVHGFPGPASAALATACAVEAAVPALLLSGRLPGLGSLARPAELLVALGGAAATPVLACAGAALALLATACTVLVRASAHTP